MNEELRQTVDESQEKKIMIFLMYLIGDSEFREHIEKDFHFVYTILQDAEADSDSYDDFYEMVIDSFKFYIDILYQELECFW